MYMRRLRYGHSLQKPISATKVFLCHQSALLLLICLAVSGAFLGVWIFHLLNEEHRTYIGDLLYKPILPITWNNAATQIVGSCLRHALLLVILFLFGLTAFGCPLILCAWVLFGFRVGIILSISYIAYGIWYTSFAVYLPLLLVGIATLLAVRRSLHMSRVYSCQLLPFGAHCGGLWSEFRHYLTSYVISVGLIIAASIAEVLLQIVITMI